MEPQFYKIVNEKIVAKNGIRMKHSWTPSREKDKDKSNNHKLIVHNNKLCVFIPSKPEKDKLKGDIFYSVKPSNMKFRVMWINSAFWGRFKDNWKKYNTIREYWRDFNKKGNIRDCEIILIDDKIEVEQKQEKNKKNVSDE